jgi:HAE1 family hydrophobic/amphiphilic exporter-1
MRPRYVLCNYSNTPGSSLERTNNISEKCKKIAEGVCKISFIFLDMKIFDRRTGSNTGTCLINLKDWDDRAFCSKS